MVGSCRSARAELAALGPRCDRALRAAGWLLALWAALTPVPSLAGRPSWPYSSPEVVIPQRDLVIPQRDLVIPQRELRRGKGAREPGGLSYSLRFAGQRHMVHLRRKKLFWPGRLRLMTQDDQGALQTDCPFFLHSKGNNKENEKTTHILGKNIC